MSRTRASRALIALLCVTIALGLVAYFRKPKTSNASEQPKVTGPSGDTATAVAGGSSAAKPAETSSPAAKPSGRPTQIALGGAGGAIITQTPTGAAPAAPVASAGPTAVVPMSAAAAAKTAAPAASGAAAPAAPAAPAKAAVTWAAPAAAPATPVNAANSAQVIATGKSLLDSNKLVEGRRVLNDALVNGQLSEADADSAKALIFQANQSLIFSPRKYEGDQYVASYNVASGDKPMKIAAAHDVTWDFLGRINGISDPRRLRAGQALKIIRGPFHAVVTKSKYTLDLYLGSPGEPGSLYVRTFKVGHGKNNSTPTGAWMVTPANKLKNPKWWGSVDEPAREPGDPQNPLGLFWIGLTGTGGEAVDKQGFGIHGTCEPDSIGKQTSHGCIRLVNDDVKQVYEVLIEGKSTIVVKE